MTVDTHACSGLQPDRWTFADAVERLEEVGGPLPALIGMQQQLLDVT
jgi:hypothetical protein